MKMTNMTPKEKAKELVDKFSKLSNYGSYALRLCEYTSKQCALIAVDEILDAQLFDINELKCWIQVKEEIEKL